MNRLFQSPYLYLTILLLLLSQTNATFLLPPFVPTGPPRAYADHQHFLQFQPSPSNFPPQTFQRLSQNIVAFISSASKIVTYEVELPQKKKKVILVKRLQVIDGSRLIKKADGQMVVMQNEEKGDTERRTVVVLDSEAGAIVSLRLRKRESDKKRYDVEAWSSSGIPKGFDVKKCRLWGIQRNGILLVEASGKYRLSAMDKDGKLKWGKLRRLYGMYNGRKYRFGFGGFGSNKEQLSRSFDVYFSSDSKREGISKIAFVGISFVKGQRDYRVFLLDLDSDKEGFGQISSFGKNKINELKNQDNPVHIDGYNVWFDQVLLLGRSAEGRIVVGLVDSEGDRIIRMVEVGGRKGNPIHSVENFKLGEGIGTRFSKLGNVFGDGMVRYVSSMEVEEDDKKKGGAQLLEFNLSY